MAYEDDLQLLQKYCVYQDRCHSEVRYKLISLKVYGDKLESIMADLISEGFLDEERYAISYAQGRCKIKKWGHNKIRQGLSSKQVSSYCIKKALNSIDREIYMNNLTHLIERRLSIKKIENEFNRKKDIVDYCLRKGYLYDEIQEVYNQVSEQ